MPFKLVKSIIFFPALRSSYIALREIFLKRLTQRTEGKKRKGRKVKNQRS
jgi:hypothetical protein